MPDREAERWAEVLVAMGAHLEAVGDGSIEDIPLAKPWAGPERMGPIPAHLEDQARQILAAQRAVIRRLQDEQATTGKHLRIVRSVPAVLGDDHSVYLDTEG